MFEDLIESWRELGDLADDSDAALIGLRDSRVQEIETTRFPWNTITYLCRDFGSGLCAGCSGTLVGPSRVLTAGHCLFSLRRMAAPHTIRVCPGRRDRDTFPYGCIPTSEYWIPRAFRDGPNRLGADWGVIVLPRPFPQLRRFLPLCPLSSAALNQLRISGLVTIGGYPSDRPVGTMWRHAERLAKFDARRLHYTVDTCPGHSGSPILARIGGRLCIVGVHTAGLLDSEGRSFGCKRDTVLAPSGSLNSGIRLTPAIVAAVRDPAAAGLIRLP